MTKPGLYAVDRGVGSEATVLLHGFGGWHGSWRHVSSQLPGRVIAYDLPGHGQSVAFHGGGPAKLAAGAILADLAARGVERAHVAGHSMGGAIAALMAMVEPDRIASLLLVAPGGIGEEINGPVLRRYAEAVSPHEIRSCLEAMSGPDSRIPDEVVQDLAALRAQPGCCEKLIEIAAAITRNDRQGVIPAERLAGLAIPVTVLWGTADPVLPFRQTVRLPQVFDLVSVAKAGHMLIEETPDRVSELLGCVR